jgi:3-methyladenine DNA glycosylase AlkD
VTPSSARSAAFDAHRAARGLHAELRAAGDPRRAAGEQQYLKSQLQHWGVSVPQLRTIIRGFTKAHPEITHADLVALVDALWEKPVHESRALAVMLLESYIDLLKKSDLRLVERLIRESKTWALVDFLAPNVAGRLVEANPGLEESLDRWAKDTDFWVRRAALLALLKPLRRGEGDFERFARYADAMLEEREFFIRKAIGWVLREVSKKRPELVYDWLLPRAARTSGVTMREAVKYLPEAQRNRVLAAYRTA